MAGRPPSELGMRMDPSRTLGRGGGQGQSWPLPRASPHLPRGGGAGCRQMREERILSSTPRKPPPSPPLPLKTKDGGSQRGTSKREKPPTAPRPRPRSQKPSTESNRRSHTDDPEHGSDPRGPIYVQVIFRKALHHYAIGSWLPPQRADSQLHADAPWAGNGQWPRHTPCSQVDSTGTK